jgi:hypothetical protein
VTAPRSATLLLLLTAAFAPNRARGADELMPGKLILVKPGRLAKFIAKPAPGDAFALPSGASAPTTGGGQLRFFKGNRADTFALPVQAAPRGWKGLGNPAGSRGFKYKGAGTTADPCKVVLIRTRIVKGLCRGGAIKLDPPATGDVGVLLTVGSTPMTYLAVFGGEEIRNTADELKRKDAPAPPACDCGTTDPMEFSFANGVGSGICGNVTDGTATKSFGCSEIVVGGGNSPVPATVFPDMVDPLRLKVAECTGKNLILGSMSAAETGSILQCSEPGCLFAPPLAFVLPITPQSACIYMRVDRAGRGTVQCDTGDASVDMEIFGAMYLTGDILPRRCSGGSNPGGRCNTVGVDPACTGGGTCVTDPDVQPCPICNPTTGICNGGNRNGLACTPASQLTPGQTFPTSHDCTVSSLVFLGDMPLPFDISTGTTVRRAFDSQTQLRAFCGFCRNPTTLCFEGDPSCPGGTNQLHRCSSDDECEPPFGACQQRSGGAFGPNGGSFATATEIGTPAGSLEDFAPHAGTLSGFFCIAPTFNAIIDASSDLPGPGANSLPGRLTLSPGGAFVDGVTHP